ncbi:amidase [Methylobacterium sp. NEAU K]|uniref:amidase n=1 Tax=Methylobacterium sp. NEAU K TaxID=3064946 RepID=UPI002732CB4D|nr:amidase [Methylobacterium sp. NEAU K]MDP4006197.1 amidase [Methylobacterium sp. NEAU K]
MTSDQPAPSTDPFLPGPRAHVAGSATGPLTGLGFAVKDLIDVAGIPTGGGNPDWPRIYPTPTRHAWVVQTLLDAGASVVGKTVTDEVSLGILGENAHDGTPLNPAAPDRVPGGSSSGSASAVASGACDFALGTDSGGSVRVPASFCGLYGIRPTHGRIDFSGVCVQAPSADTCGWFARDPATFARVGEVLFGKAMPDRLPDTLLVAADALGFADEAVQRALIPLIDRLAALIGNRRDVTMAPQGLSVWQRAQRVLQSSEAWQTFEPWLDTCNPRLAFSVARALVQGSMMTEAERNAATLMRIEARARLVRLLPPGTILCLPTTPFPAPLRGLPLSTLNPLRERIGCLTSHGGLTGVPQVNIPGGHVEGAPVGLSIIGARGADLDLIRTAVALEA